MGTRGANQFIGQTSKSFLDVLAKSIPSDLRQMRVPLFNSVTSVQCGKTRRSTKVRTCTASAAALLTIGITPAIGRAQRAQVSPQVRGYVAVDTTVVALTNARVIDGTGAPAKESQTIIIRDGRITELGPSTQIKPPVGAQQIDLT